jgi:hypothetical protein
MKVETHGTLVYVDGKMVKGTIEEVNSQIANGGHPTIESEGEAMRRVASALDFPFANNVLTVSGGREKTNGQ